MVTKPFIILDFDGVIANRGFQSHSIKELNAIVHATGAELVISSSWRESHTLPELIEILRSVKVLGKVIGQTPILPEMRSDITEWQKRVSEIEAFLYAHAPVAQPFVILDDQRFASSMFEGRFVATHYATGLTAVDTFNAVAILKSKMLPYYQEMTDWALPHEYRKMSYPLPTLKEIHEFVSKNT